MMSYINETDFVVENKKLVYPEIVTDGLQLYYDAKGKRDTDYHRDTMLDMSGNKNHGKLHNFAYEKHSGYKDGLVFDYIDDKLVRPTLNLKPDDFTFMLNGNIISFSPDGTVKRVQDGEVIESKGFNLIRNGNFSDGLRGWSSPYGSGATVGQEYTYTVTSLDNPSSRLETTNNVPNPIGGHKYYVSGEIYPTRDSIQTRFNYTDTISFYPEANKWSKLSGILAPSKSSTEPFRFYHSNISYGIGDTWKYRNIQLIDLTETFGAGNEPTKEEMDEIINRFGFIPNAQDLIDRIEYKGNTLGDMENIIDGLYKTEVLSGEEIFTDKADSDAVVHAEVDGKSYQHAGSGKNLIGYKELKNHPPDERWSGNNRVNLKLKPNTDYTLSSDIPLTGSPVVWFNGGSMPNVVSKDAPKTYRTDSTGENLWFMTFYSRTYGSELYNGTYYIQLEEGSVATEYEEYEPPAPTPDYPIEIQSLNDFDVVSSVGGRNLLPTKPELFSVDGTYGYIKLTDINEKLTIHVYDNDTSIDVSNLFFGFTSNGSDASVAEPGGVVRWKLSNGRLNTGIVTNMSINKYFSYYPKDKETLTKIFRRYKIKIERGDVATSWTPAPEDITENSNHPLIDKINLLLSEPLRSVGDVKDRLFRDNDGLWKIERNVAEGYADGSEDWVYQSAYGRFDASTSFLPISGADTSASPQYNTRNSHYGFSGVANSKKGYFTWVVGRNPRIIHGDMASVSELKAFTKSQYDKGTPVTWVYQVAKTIEILEQELQDKLNNLRSFQDSNYVYTIINDKTDILSDNLKPTLHAKFLYNNWYKEDRVINNLMIYNRALTNEEMLQNYKTIKRRWGM